MNFTLTAEQQQIQKLAREFAEKDLLPGVIERDETSTFPMEAYHKMAREMGFVGLPYPKEYGGQDGSYVSYILAVEEISKVDASMGISYSVSTSLYGGSIMGSSATDEQKKRFLEPVASGKSLGSFGLTEHSAGSDAAGQLTRATKDGDDWIINGSKCFITNGPVADYFAVYCLTDPELGTKGMACFVLEKGMPGFSIGHRKQDGHPLRPGFRAYLSKRSRLCRPDDCQARRGLQAGHEDAGRRPDRRGSPGSGHRRGSL